MSLWKGRMLSHAATPFAWPVVLGNGENVGLLGDCEGCGIELQGQASPRETPLMAVRDGGQMGARPFMRMFQSTGKGTMMTLDACVEGWERMWSVFWGQQSGHRGCSRGNLPSMLPGRPSSPKNSLFSKALPRRMSSCALPSMPAISLPGPDCSP